MVLSAQSHRERRTTIRTTPRHAAMGQDDRPRAELWERPRLEQVLQYEGTSS